MAEARKIKLSERKHPLYTENEDKWELYKNAVKGGKDFINDLNLFSHRLESTEDFEERLARAYYLNFCETIPAIYNNFIFKEKVERPSNSDIDGFINNTDGKGTGMSDFVARIGYLSKVFGAMHVLVDMPRMTEGVPWTIRAEKEAGVQPYCKLIYPKQLKDWSVDSEGNFNWVIIEDTYYRDVDPTIERKEEKIFLVITKEEWRYEDEEGKPFKFEDEKETAGTNTLKHVPIITLYNKDIDNDRIGESMLKDIVFINRVIMNWCSCLDEMIERQAFAQLIIPDDGSLSEESEHGDDPLKKLGTSVAWTFNASARHPPAFISPDTKHMTVIWKLIVDHIKEIYRLSGLIGTSEDMAASRSGRAAQMGFLGVNSALAESARNYQQFENDISRLAMLLMGKDPQIFEEVKYPDSFDIQSLNDEVDAYFTVMEKNLSQTMNKEMMKTLARRALPMATPGTKDKINSEIDAGDGYVQPTQTRAQIMGEELSHRENVTGKSQGDKKINPQDGNPNMKKIGDTFRTKDRQTSEETGHRTQPQK